MVEAQMVTAEERSLQPGSQYYSLVKTNAATIQLDVVQTADGVNKETSISPETGKRSCQAMKNELQCNEK